MTDNWEGIDETTGVRQRREAERAVRTAETAIVDTETMLRERRSLLNSIREIYRENHFGEKYALLLQSTHGGNRATT